MKKFYFLGVAALLSASAMTASPGAPLLGGEPRDGIANGSYRLRSESDIRLTRPVSGTAPVLTSGPAKTALSRAEVKPAEITLAEIVTTPPAGEKTTYSRDCVGYWSFSTKIYDQVDKGGVVNMVKGDNNEVWLDNPLALMALKSWMKGTLSNDGKTITFKGAQAVYAETLNEETTYFYMAPLEFVVEKEDGSGWYYPTADATYEYDLDGTTWKPRDLTKVHGLCRLMDDGTLSWIGYGNYDQILTPQTSTLTELPEGLTYDKWVVKYDGGGHMADVARTDTKMYVRGLLPNAPQGWAVGNVTRDRVVFPVGQYVGETTDMHFAYVFGGEVRSEYNEYYDTYFNNVYASRQLEFTYNAADMILSECPAVTCVTLNYRAGTNPDTYQVQSSIVNPTVRYLVRDPECPPANPYSISIFAYDDQTGYGFVDFRFLNEDANGYILPTEDLYYRVFMNGKLHTFYPDEYGALEAPMVLVPYNFYDLYDFDVQGYLHTFYYYSDSLDTMGIQTIYKPEGIETPLVSNLISFDVIGGIHSDMADKTVSTQEWFDLQGRRVENPASGLYIVRTVYTDGTVSTTKTVKK